ncbi:MAG: polyisoprenoid-binding protein [Thermoleophilia bacterium]|nr:polyisoprenoid-binding protein [Thermoleophilia bacterium]
MSILADTSATVIPAGTWSIDPAHSAVEFHIKHLGLATVKGRAPVVSGAIGGGEEPSIQGTVAVASITTFDENRDGHLQSPEFFDVERYPELSFESTEIEFRGDDLRVEGELTIKGITKPVTLRGTFVGSGVDPWGNDRVGIDLEGTIDRTDWGLNWNAPLPGGGFLLPNDVKLTATFSAVKAG